MEVAPELAEIDDELPDNDEPEVQKTIIQIHPVSPASRNSRCTVCSRLNPSLDGMLLTKQRVRVEGGRWVVGEVRIKLRAYKNCAPAVNPHCPASEVLIVVGMNVESKARQYVRALATNNLEVVSQIAGEMALLDEALRKSFAAAVSALQASSEAADG